MSQALVKGLEEKTISGEVKEPAPGSTRHGQIVEKGTRGKKRGAGARARKKEIE